MLSSVPGFVWAFLAGLVLSIVLLQSVKHALSGPTVYRSWETKQCDHVVNDDGTAGDCAKIPSRYHNVWVY